MQSPSDLSLCSDLAQRAFQCLLKTTKESNIRTSTVMGKLGHGLGVDQMEVKGVVRELYRAGLLKYTPDRQDIPANGMIMIVRPEKTVSPTEQEWGRALDGSGLSAATKEALRPFFCKVSDLNFHDMACLAECLSGLESGRCQVDDAGFNVSARSLMGGSKVLAYLPPKMLQALGLPLRLHTSSPRYVVCAGPATPESTLLIENPRAFENAVRSGLGKCVALVCTYGFGLSYLGQAWRDNAHAEDKPIQIIRAGNPPSLTNLLAAQRVFLWADLDLAALGIFRSLKTAIPQLQFSGIYKVMMEVVQDSSKSHPYAAIFEKDGQTSVSASIVDASDAAIRAVLESCRMRAVDQEAVIERDILRLGHLPLEIGDGVHAYQHPESPFASC